ncbi:MAG: glycosyltransferase, partial [Candidatus Eremiobacteraeota bacterium]|nr:glycosyltransferase [Candidatus Eremiobacteraeota bacterium]
MGQPTVSVVIPAFNATQTIGQTLAALNSQAGAAHFETIVVDNGSSDDTAAIAQRFGALVLNEEKRGPAAARNCGLRAARGDIILHCDADTVPSRRWVSEMLKAFVDPTTVLVAGNTLCYPPTTAAERFVERNGLYDTQRLLNRPVLPFALTLNLGVRRAAALSIGGFCEELITAEDVDFSQRLLSAFQTRIVYRENALLYHHCRSDAQALSRQAYSYG